MQSERPTTLQAPRIKPCAPQLATIGMPQMLERRSRTLERRVATVVSLLDKGE